jgi:hypothetical protein
MVKKYVFSKLKEVDMKNVTFKTIQVTRGGKNKTFTIKDIDALYQQLKDQNIKSNDIQMNIMGITNDFTVKHWNCDALYNTDDYYIGRAVDPSKFDSYDYVNVTIKERH